MKIIYQYNAYYFLTHTHTHTKKKKYIQFKRTTANAKKKNNNKIIKIKYESIVEKIY
jgi:hypothetical protein